ncbi:hypothetical protein [Paenibacillus sp. YYML68]|uniref:hypothetical protein n=1 Tax=Paenibacillus sp. YYML68 TaxID=2909250 RepID=UPI00248FB081|nr:hypothetical protein [Paenibacillus sp. YYML68]
MVVMMITIFSLILIAFSYRMICSVKGYNKLQEEINHFNSIRAHTCSENVLYILLPCHKEQSIVEETLSYFWDLVKNESNVVLIAITGEAETIDKRANIDRIHALIDNWWAKFNQELFYQTNNGVFPLSYYNNIELIRLKSLSFSDFKNKIVDLYQGIPSTNQLIQQWQGEHVEDRVILLHDCNPHSNKSSKINYALHFLLERHDVNSSINLGTTYLAVYDFDSRPHEATFKWFNWKVNQLNLNDEALPAVFQQIPHQLGSQIQQISKNSLSFSTAIWHLERTLGIEAYLLYSNIWKSKFIRGCMGAGIFINMQQLKEMHGVPEHNDDISFGYRLDVIGKSRCSIPFPNYSQPTPSTFNKVRQYKRIYSAVFSAGLELEWSKKFFPKYVEKNGRMRIISTYINDNFHVFRFISFLLLIILTLCSKFYFLGAMLISVSFLSYWLTYKSYLNFANRLLSLGNYPPLRPSIFARLVSVFSYDVFKVIILTHFLCSMYIKKDTITTISIDKTDR